ncbi:UBX domain-containing protein 6 [Homalodisca vitripennis]|nr:UBX domain-containing protein 6 [Homalodisca vitripennis]
MDALHSAEPIGLELDRNVQVLLPTQAAQKTELPPAFFTMTPDEVKREQQLRTERVESSLVLRTKAMREKEEQREMKKYRFALIRVRFPDGILLQLSYPVLLNIAVSPFLYRSDSNFQASGFLPEDMDFKL